jgi:dTDP-L-rhamnose 4-epimerase
VEDVVDANMLVLEKDEANGQAFNVGSGRATSILEYAQQVLARIQNPAGFQLSGEYRRGDNRHSVSSVAKLTRLGWQPKRGLDQILDDFLDWVETSGGVPLDLPDATSAMRSAGVLLGTSH